MRKLKIRKPGNLRGLAEISETLAGDHFIFVEANALETKEALRLSAWLLRAAAWLKENEAKGERP